MIRSPWARVYARTPGKYIWGTEPSALARAASALLMPRARVLDLGCGEGRDSVFFASAGFEVTGADCSLAGLRKAERLAQERGVTVSWIHGDMAHLPAHDPVDLVYSCGAIHYVPRSGRVRLFARLKALTRAGGYHALVVFTSRAVYVEKHEVIDYFDPGEIADAYADWLILQREEQMITCAQDGTAHRHSVEQLLAQKPAVSR